MNALPSKPVSSTNVTLAGIKPSVSKTICRMSLLLSKVIA